MELCRQHHFLEMNNNNDELHLCILHAPVNNPYFDPKTCGNQEGLLVKVNEFIIVGVGGGGGG